MLAPHAFRCSPQCLFPVRANVPHPCTQLRDVSVALIIRGHLNREEIRVANASPVRRTDAALETIRFIVLLAHTQSRQPFLSVFAPIPTCKLLSMSAPMALTPRGMYVSPKCSSNSRTVDVSGRAMYDPTVSVQYAQHMHITCPPILHCRARITRREMSNDKHGNFIAPCP